MQYIVPFVNQLEDKVLTATQFLLSDKSSEHFDRLLITDLLPTNQKIESPFDIRF
jgi:hypothetical protein